MAFNNEMLVRELADFPVPTIVAVGHDKDIPLLALAADKMVSTPTAAANLLNQSWQRLEWEIKEKETRIFSFLPSFFETARFEEYKAEERIFKAMEQKFNYFKAKLEKIQAIIQSNDPRRNLALGYSIARKSGKVIRTIEEVKRGDNIDLEVIDGIIKSKVNERKKFKAKS